MPKLDPHYASRAYLESAERLPEDTGTIAGPAKDLISELQGHPAAGYSNPVPYDLAAEFPATAKAREMGFQLTEPGQSMGEGFASLTPEEMQATEDRLEAYFAYRQGLMNEGKLRGGEERMLGPRVRDANTLADWDMRQERKQQMASRRQKRKKRRASKRSARDIAASAGANAADYEL